jgi:hypothetical protein
MLGSRARTRRARRVATLLVTVAVATVLLGVAPAAAGGKPMPAAASSIDGNASR